MSHLLVETLKSPTGQSERERAFDGPATETQNARLEQVGCFRQDDVTKNQTATALPYQAVDANAPTSFVAGRKGKIIGIVANVTADLSTNILSAGSATFTATIGGVAVGDALVLDSTHHARTNAFDAPVDFDETDLLGLALATSSNMEPDDDSNFHGWLLIRWTAESVAPV